MILYRCSAWNRRAEDDAPDGALWSPRPFQGEGRHDNPDVYGCLHLADRAVSCVVEQLAAFRGQRLTPALLKRRGLPLAVAQIEIADTAPIIDLDDPAVLSNERLRPSRVATRDRAITQPQALALHRAHPQAAGLRWWSTWEAQWANVTMFDRAAPLLRLVEVTELKPGDDALDAAAEFFGLRVT